MLRKFVISITALLIGAAAAMAVEKQVNEKPDFAKIKAETLDENSKYYYPKLMAEFMRNDTTMTYEAYKHFYYGALFQEDYNPYRKPVMEDERKHLDSLYFKPSHTRAEREEIRRYAVMAIEDNPLDLIQLRNLVYVYEQNGKVTLAKIWKHKLNHLLQVIGSSGTGFTPEDAWYIVFPRHEFDFLNITGLQVQGRAFQEPYYERITVAKRGDKDPDTYYFNLQPVLEQYYIKHPSER